MFIETSLIMSWYSSGRRHCSGLLAPGAQPIVPAGQVMHFVASSAYVPNSQVRQAALPGEVE